MKKYISIIYLTCFLLYNNFYAQEKKKLQATYTNEKIILDGMDNELSWTKTQVTTDEFYQLIPLREVKASQNNSIKIIYDDKYLYIFAKATTKDGKASIPSLERDYQIQGTDAIFFFIRHVQRFIKCILV